MIPALILTAAVVPFVAGLLWAFWRDPHQQERRRAMRELREDRRWQKWSWPE